ncbi:RICIN domain-containing protein [Silvibacterium acidisoli]|uniref:RICIN domain-containing protein n=1 Tax=Acidobacteriaceae bacterium ZG23-2 TaxID=2883246 RepID=UPI00406D1FE1
MSELNQEAQFSTNRYAILFKPGTYGSTGSPVVSQVGFYEQIAGLGISPDSVNITGGFNVDALIDGNMTQNFWRSQENLHIVPSGGPTNGVIDWGVSQGASLRRMDIGGGVWYANSQPIGTLNACQESSGGFTADSSIQQLVNACSQQQWYTRNTSLLGGFTGYVWNFVFSGVSGMEPQQSYPGGPSGDANVTLLPTTPVRREKPFLYVDSQGNYNVQVSDVQRNTVGTDWNGVETLNGHSLPISDFFIATPSTSVDDINAALAAGQNLILTPGIYQYSVPIYVGNPNTIVLGLGYATLVPQAGEPALAVDDVDGVQIAGLLFDAGPSTSPMLVEIGHPGTINQGHSDNPTSLNDVFFRIGGSTAGSVDTALQIDSGDVILDNIWAWRADHGNAGTYGWTVNTANHGVVVNGKNVTALGLAVEHFQQTQTQWNGDNGQTIFYQSEFPYDVPNQASWMNGTSNGYPSYAVSPDSVCTHKASGLGMYSFFNQGVNIVVDNAMTVPAYSGVQVSDVGTVFLTGSGQISNVVDGIGGAANSANVSQEVPVASYQGSASCPASTVFTTGLTSGSTVPLTAIADPNPNNWDTTNIMAAIRNPHPDLVTVAAHRGVHALAGTDQAPNVPENSLQAIGLAAQAGWEAIEIDVKLTSDGVPILTHDKNWGREWCGLGNFNFSGAPFDPFNDPATDARNPLVANTALSDTRSFLGNTVLRDSVSLLSTIKNHGCWGLNNWLGVYAPTLQDVYDYIRKNNIEMVVELDVQGLDFAKAAWPIVQESKDAQGRSFAKSTIFKMPAFLFPTTADYIAAFGDTYSEVNFNPVFHTNWVDPSGARDNGVFTTEAQMNQWITNFESNPNINISAIEVTMKDYLGIANGSILTSVLQTSKFNQATGQQVTISNFNPVGDYFPGNNPANTPAQFFNTDGTCCHELEQDLFNSIDGSTPVNPNLPWDHADNRPDPSYLIGNEGVQMITTDNPIGVSTYAASLGKRNTSYMEAGSNVTTSTPTGGAAPEGYTLCAPENSTCSFTGTSIVAFGVNGRFIYQTFTNGVACTDTAFGNDPDVGVVKACYLPLISDGQSYVFQNESSQMYLDNDCDGCSGSATDNVAVIQWASDGSTAQNWTLHSQGNGYYTIVSAQSGLCLDDPYGNGIPSRTLPQSAGTSTMLWQHDCNGQTTQNWELIPQADGSVIIQNQAATAANGGTTMVIDDYDAETIPGLQMWLYPAMGTATQNWLVSQPHNTSAPPTGSAPPSGYTLCASENNQCSFSGTATVAFGADGRYLYGNFTNGTSCTAATFGNDPVYGVVKSCYIPTPNTTQAAPPGTTVPSGYTFCAAENSQCSFTGTATVAFGANGQYLYQTFTNGVACTTTAFGNDPDVGVVKACFIPAPNTTQAAPAKN